MAENNTTFLSLLYTLFKAMQYTSYTQFCVVCIDNLCTYYTLSTGRE